VGRKPSQRDFGEYRLCVRCEDIKPKGEFGKDKRRWDGVAVYCKQCNNKRIKDIRNDTKRRT